MPEHEKNWSQVSIQGNCAAWCLLHKIPENVNFLIYKARKFSGRTLHFLPSQEKNSKRKFLQALKSPELSLLTV